MALEAVPQRQLAAPDPPVCCWNTSMVSSSSISSCRHRGGGKYPHVTGRGPTPLGARDTTLRCLSPELPLVGTRGQRLSCEFPTSLLIPQASPNKGTVNIRGLT